MAINFNTVISELNLIVQLQQDNPKDKRLKQMVADAQADLAKAAETISGDADGHL